MSRAQHQQPQAAPSGSALAARITAIWTARRSGQVANAINLFSEVTSIDAGMLFALPLPDGADASTQGAGIATIDRHVILQLTDRLAAWPVQAAELLTLYSSFLLRAQHMHRARAVLEVAREKSDGAGTPLSEQMIFQLGLQYCVEGDYIEALRYFQRLRDQISTSPLVRLQALVNILLCKEKLGLEVDSDLAGLADVEASLIKHAPKDATGAVVQETLGQVDALLLRIAFDRGDSGAISALTKKPLRGVQAIYFAGWMASLPYAQFDGQQMLVTRATQFLAEHRGSYLADYRLATLIGDVKRRSANESIRASAVVERLYLWTWRWLVKPSRSQLESVLSTMETLRNAAEGSLSAPEAMMCDNACRWLRLFSIITDQDLAELGQGVLAAGDPPANFVLVEHMLLANCAPAAFGWRYSKAVSLAETSAQMRQSMLGHDWLLKLHKAIITPSAELCLEPSWVGGISTLFAAEQTAMQESGCIVVDLASSRIAMGAISDRKVIVHQALSRLLAGLTESHSRSISIAELVRICFGLSRYDSSVHDTRVAKLLWRANQQLAGQVEVSKRAGRIHLRALCRIHLVGRLAYAELDLANGFTATSSRTRGDIAEEVADFGLARLRHDVWYTRFTIERELGVSRATAARRIREWLEQGVVQADGRGRNIRYRVTP